MNPNNPDPLEVWREANRAFNQKETAHDYNNPDTRAERIRLANQAAAATIAQHYAPVIAENERLMGQISELADFIMAEVPGEPSQNEGAVDCAIRVIRQHLGAKP